jgi:glyoxylase-like metal-dependent hydrolase (beta-lactamase superfamily II)
MTRPIALALLAALSLAACTRLTPEQQIVGDAATALGGRERILAVKTLIIEGQGTQYTLGEDLAPNATGQTYSVTGYRRAVDLGGARARVELTRTPNFPLYLGPAPQKQVQGLDGSLGYNVGPNGMATRIPDGAAADRRAEWMLHPLLAVRAALDPTAKVVNPRAEGGQSLVDVTTADGQAFTLAIDATTKLPARISTRRDDAYLGDVTLSTSVSNYQDVGGLKLPTTLVSSTDSFTTASITVAKQALDGNVGDLAAPTAAAAAAAITAPPPQTVTAMPLAKGITMLAGGSHHSVLVEFKDHLLLIEAPLDEARAMAVIGKARELVPGKPLTQLVNTHFHFDHSGGVRTAMAEGLSVITHQGNVAFFEEMARRPHTLRPDALSKAGKAPPVEGVADQRTITDGTMTVTLYTESGPHVRDMLFAYFPKERLLVEADLYTVGGSVMLFARDFLEELKQRNLRIDRIAPLHGTVATYAQFLKDAAAPAPAVKAN